jgi:hypothetical protein
MFLPARFIDGKSDVSPTLANPLTMISSNYSLIARRKSFSKTESPSSAILP